MRAVPVEGVEQQAVLSAHCARQGIVMARTARANQIRGHTGESGLAVQMGISHVAKRAPEPSDKR
ncbi:MAG: hypothetical protein JO006_13630 [Paucibacter sp.]|nr:hypothetical protein [Roseateles sp.]